MKSFFFLLFFLLFTYLAAADCWKDVTPGQHSKEIKCFFEDWKRFSSQQNLKSLIDSVFYVYITDGQNPSMKMFFDGMRSGDPRFADVFKFKNEIIKRYTFDNAGSTQTTELWAMQPFDAKRLFVLSQTDPASVPRDITAAMYMAIYDELERYFYLNSIHNNEFGVLPASEYLRLQEILARMAWVDDPFLKATNLIYRGLVSLNLAQRTTGLNYASDSSEILSEMLSTAVEKLSKKRILRTRALANAILGELLKAESDYFAILKLDPEDWDALLDLSYVLNRRGECSERGIWIEASLLKGKDQFDIVVHCGNQTYPEETFPTEPPAIASLSFLPHN
jgi:tetratricopeptide (TPR) repeat protein